MIAALIVGGVLLLAGLALLIWMGFSSSRAADLMSPAAALVPMVVGLAIALTASIVLMDREDKAWGEACAERGGHVATTTETGLGTGVGANGAVTTVVTSHSTSFCLSEDGRILAVRS